MRRFKKETVEHTVLHHLECDLCPAKSIDGDWWQAGTGNSRGHSTLKYTQVTDIGNTQQLETREVDLCPKCMERVLNWLRTAGATVQTKVSVT